MTKLLRNLDKLRSIVPRTARERLYDMHPGRARRWRRYPGLEFVPAGGHAVLTFDDGPDQDSTPLVLEALDSAGATATFFLLGSQLETHADIGREVARRGHEIGLHGYNHQRHDRIDAAQSRDDLRRGLATLEDKLATRCRWYRPPYGKMSPAAMDACCELNLAPVYWSAWGLDWEDVDASRIASVVGQQLTDGGIVLLHDSALHARRRTAQPTAEAIAFITQAAGERGISLVSLGRAARNHDPVAV